MSWAVRAWRDPRGTHGISIGTVVPVGYDNHVAEIWLDDAEIDEFILQCQQARKRAAQAVARMDEPMPGPYERWPGD